MQFHYIPYIWPLVISAVVSLSLGLYAFLVRRNVKGTTSFILSMFVVTIWSLANALEMAGTDFATKLFWANIQYFAYCYSPVALLALCMQFTGYDRWIRNKKIFWVAVIPMIVFLLVWTDRTYGLIRYDMHLDYSGPFTVITKKYGPVFYIHMLYSHSVNIAALVLTIMAMFSKNKVHRKQAAALFTGIILIILPNLMYILGLSPVEKFDLTPVFFGPAGLIIAWGIYRYRLFDIVPLARATLVETMDTGVMVMDLQGRVLDINPAFRRIVELNISKKLIITVSELFSKMPELLIACKDCSVDYCEFTKVVGESEKIYEALFSPLADNNGQVIARLVVFHEVTCKKRAQQEFLKQQRKLAALQEREQMARNMHDNLGQVLGY
ncbi:MAG: histidine kinase N-terminal 7TM domain-containing protein, partial [Eubacteriales bacterium]